jgi:uncharacterized membrane protein YphA (DoxX/SURF4 family)
VTARATGSSVAIENADRTRPRGRGLGLHIALWVAQIALATLFGTAGFTKLTTPIGVLAQRLAWTSDVPLALVRFIGAAELAAALGLLLPAAFRVRP